MISITYIHPQARIYEYRVRYNLCGLNCHTHCLTVSTMKLLLQLDLCLSEVLQAIITLTP